MLLSELVCKFKCSDSPSFWVPFPRSCSIVSVSSFLIYLLLNICRCKNSSLELLPILIVLHLPVVLNLVCVWVQLLIPIHHRPLVFVNLRHELLSHLSLLVCLDKRILDILILILNLVNSLPHSWVDRYRRLISMLLFVFFNWLADLIYRVIWS